MAIDKLAAFVGDWRGQAQFQGTLAGKIDPAAQTVSELSVKIEPGGRLTGASATNGCKLQGTATPGAAPTVANLEITFSGCTYPELNRKFMGNLIEYPKDRYVALSLNANQLATGGKKPATYSVKATIRH